MIYVYQVGLYMPLMSVKFAFAVFKYSGVFIESVHPSSCLYELTWQTFLVFAKRCKGVHRWLKLKSLKERTSVLNEPCNIILYKCKEL